MYMYSVHLVYIHTVYAYESHFSKQQVLSIANDVTPKITRFTLLHKYYYYYASIHLCFIFVGLIHAATVVGWHLYLCTGTQLYD